MYSLGHLDTRHARVADCIGIRLRVRFVYKGKSIFVVASFALVMSPTEGKCDCRSKAAREGGAIVKSTKSTHTPSKKSKNDANQQSLLPGTYECQKDENRHRLHSRVGERRLTDEWRYERIEPVDTEAAAHHNLQAKVIFKKATTIHACGTCSDFHFDLRCQVGNCLFRCSMPVSSVIIACSCVPNMIQVKIEKSTASNSINASIMTVTGGEKALQPASVSDSSPRSVQLLSRFQLLSVHAVNCHTPQYKPCVDSSAMYSCRKLTLMSSDALSTSAP